MGKDIEKTCIKIKIKIDFKLYRFRYIKVIYTNQQNDYTHQMFYVRAGFSR